ncbi:MAG: MalY/PatB family protein [Sulfuriferula sp.]
MSFDFDQTISREGTDSVKYDARIAYFGTADVTPLWVADMDFAAPPAVTAALAARAAHPIYGYTRYPDSLYDALIGWMQRRHGWAVQREWIVMCPGVVPSLHAAVIAFAQQGEGVIVQPPVYFPFFSAVTSSARQLVENPLQLIDGRYRIDFDHLEQCAANGAKLLLLCSPHNPVGRVWQPDELAQILRIARHYGLVVLSDEIHADLVYPDQHHTVMATLADESDSLITAVAPSKTFNIPGLGLSCLIIPNPEVRAAIGTVFASQHVNASNPFSIVAFETAYREGGAWLEALMAYLQGTRELVRGYIREHLPGIRAIAPEGTYLMWLDCRDMQLSDVALRDFFIHQARLGMNPGTVFGTGGSGFMRLNLASPRHVVMAALRRVSQAQGLSG